MKSQYVDTSGRIWPIFRDWRVVWTRRVLSSLPVLALAGCATAPLERAGSLMSYDNLKPSPGVLTQSLIWVDAPEVRAAQTVRLMPTVFSAKAAQVRLNAAQRKLIANTIDRSLCIGLSEKFVIVRGAGLAELTVQAVVTHVTVTDETMAAASKVASVVPSILGAGVPIPVPRIPIGLGSLSLEAEARAPGGQQRAAMIWARGANSIISTPRVSAAGDAYDLASAFGEDFSKLLITGASPFGAAPALPAQSSLISATGAAHKDVACEAFGRSPGIVGLVGGRIGLPPEWTDSGAAKPH